MLEKFDPWQSKLCTCPSKLSLNPYTGCEHRCIYCYASSYVKNFFNCRPKKNLIPRLKDEARRLNGDLISISNSSDPYPSIEENLKLTRSCLEILSKSNCRVQIITKSSLVSRDVDILKRMKAMVAITITTSNDELSKKLEPNAPLSSQRIEAVKSLIESNIPVAVRIDPIIPFLNERQKKLIKILASIGVRHITSSTYKAREDNWQRVILTFPELAEKLKKLYFEKGKKIGRSYYLPKEMRLRIMKKIKELVEKEGMKFACCREGFPKLNSATCDGSWLI
jgi:DNA repair photolyase